jgi:hypothetical protein
MRRALGTAGAQLTVFEIRPDGDGTLVTWRMVGPNTGMTWLLGVVLSRDRRIGPDLEKGRVRLQADAESPCARASRPRRARLREAA